MKIEIENYRGFDISFDTDSDEFYGLSDRYDKDFNKKSFTSAKKYIDDFIKENYEFKPFKVEPNLSSSWSGKHGTVIGIRKDKRFVIELENGKKEQISDYDEKNYMLPNPDNKFLKIELEKIKLDIQNLYKRESDVKSKLKVKTLSDYKKELE